MKSGISSRYPWVLIVVALGWLGSLLSGCQLFERTVQNNLAVSTTTLDEQPPEMLSAFFGLDNALPLIGAVI